LVAVDGSSLRAQRQRWMGVLARADVDALERGLVALPISPTYEILRAPETGLVMMRGRAGGDGAPFNVGEMTVTRCVVKPAGGPLGFGYVAGRDRRHAELAAVFDGLLQQEALREPLLARVIEPLARAQAQARQERWSEAATTKVDFFTVVRGEG
jgi:alpha-D-ribose 1-methylphosphonate 5-triphosphate synthase subunit PhnG